MANAIKNFHFDYRHTSLSSQIVFQGISYLDNLLSCWVSSFSVHNPATSLTSLPWKVWLHDLGVLIVEDYGPSNMKPFDEASIGIVRLWGNGLKHWEDGMWEAESCQQRVLSHGKQTELIWSVCFINTRELLTLASARSQHLGGSEAKKGDKGSRSKAPLPADISLMVAIQLGI